MAYLSNLIFLVSETDLKPSEYSESNIGVPYITGASNISNENKIIINRYTNKKYVNSHLNDVLLSCKGTIGRTVTNNTSDMHIARQFVALTAFIPNDFLIICLSSIASKLTDEAKSMIPGIDRKQILNKIVFLPPY